MDSICQPIIMSSYSVQINCIDLENPEINRGFDEKSNPPLTITIRELSRFGGAATSPNAFRLYRAEILM